MNDPRTKPLQGAFTDALGGAAPRDRDRSREGRELRAGVSAHGTAAPAPRAGDAARCPDRAASRTCAASAASTRCSIRRAGAGTLELPVVRRAESAGAAPMSATPAAATPHRSPVREALQKLSGESLVYGLGAVGGRAVQLLLVPILTRALTPDAFGVGELVMAYSQTAILVLVFGMDGALARFFYDEPDREARVRMASSSLLFRLALAAVVSAGVALAAGPIAAQLIGGDVYRKYLMIGAVTLPFTLMVLFGNDVLRVTFQPLKFIGLNITETVLVGGLSVWFVSFKGMGVAGMLYGRLIGDAVCAGLALLPGPAFDSCPRFSRDALRRMLALRRARACPPSSRSAPSPRWTGTSCSGSARLRRWGCTRSRSSSSRWCRSASRRSRWRTARSPSRARARPAPRLFARVLTIYTALSAAPR